MVGHVCVVGHTEVHSKKQYKCNSKAFVNVRTVCMFTASLVVECISLPSALGALGRSVSYLIVRPCDEDGVWSPISGTVLTAYIILHIEIPSSAFPSFVMAPSRRNGPQWPLEGI